MKINNIQLSQRNEVVVVSRKVNFGSVKSDGFPKAVINRFCLDMTKKVGFSGKTRYRKAPVSVSEDVRSFLKALKVDWKTHVDQNSHKSSM